MSANLSGLQSLFAARLSAAIAAAEAATGAKASFLSGRRTAAQGVEIWNRATDFGRHAPSFAAAPPGKSLHEQGMAVDMADGPVRNWVQAHAKEYGLEAATAYDRAHGKWSHDPPHIQLARGTPKTAYDSTPSMWAGDGQRLPPENIPNVAPAAQGPATLRKGMSDRSTNGAVSQLQSSLAAGNFYKGKIDGQFGPQTAAAVRAFEQSSGLNVDRGVAGPQVLGRLASTTAAGDIMSARAIAPGGPGAVPDASPLDIAFGRPPQPDSPAVVSATPYTGTRGQAGASRFSPGGSRAAMANLAASAEPPAPGGVPAYARGPSDIASSGGLTSGGPPSELAANPPRPLDAPGGPAWGASGPSNVGAGLMPQYAGGPLHLMDANNPAFGAKAASGLQDWTAAAPPGGGPWGTSPYFSDPNGANGIASWVDPPLSPTEANSRDPFAGSPAMGYSPADPALLRSSGGSAPGGPIDPQTLAMLQRNVPGANDPFTNWQRDQLANTMGGMGGNSVESYSRGFTGTPSDPTTGINGVMAGLRGGPAALGGAVVSGLGHASDTINGWFSGGNPAAFADPGLFNRVPPAVHEPYGVPSDIMPYSPLPQQQSSLSGFGSSNVMFGNAGADRFGPAGGERAPFTLARGDDGYTTLPGGIPQGQPGLQFDAPPAAYVPQPAIRTDPVQQQSMLRSAGGESQHSDYKSLGGGNGPGGYNVASNSYAPWSGAAPYQGYMGGGFATPSGNYSNSPYTPSGYTAPNFTPGSGGSTYATMPNGYGGGTYVDSHGNVHQY